MYVRSKILSHFARVPESKVTQDCISWTILALRDFVLVLYHKYARERDIAMYGAGRVVLDAGTGLDLFKFFSGHGFHSLAEGCG